MQQNINKEQKNMDFDHLGIQRGDSIKLKITNFSETKRSEERRVGKECTSWC